VIECRSIFVSDVHLGTPDCQAAYLLDFLRSTRAQFLYLVGDIIDLEALAQRSHWPPAHTAVLAEIVAIAARGTRVVYIPGNHDAALRGLHGQTVSGIQVRLRAEHVAADGRRYRVSHGDEFDHDHTGRRWLTWIGEHSHRGLRWCNRSLNRARRAIGLPYLPLSIVTKSRIAAAMDFIAGFEQRVAEDCARAGYDGHICGHIHFGAMRRIGEALYLNDGDWVEHCTALVEDDGGAFRLLHWSEHRSELARSIGDRLLPAARAPLAFASLSPQRVAAASERASLAA
jgi:UDP-2,3-diacylglucosamine pyrophosphatase LpxH